MIISENLGLFKAGSTITTSHLPCRFFVLPFKSPSAAIAQRLEEFAPLAQLVKQAAVGYVSFIYTDYFIITWYGSISYIITYVSLIGNVLCWFVLIAFILTVFRGTQLVSQVVAPICAAQGWCHVTIGGGWGACGVRPWAGDGFFKVVSWWFHWINMA